MRKSGKQIFLIWKEDPNDESGGFWATYDSIKQASESNNDGSEIFSTTLEFLGTLKTTVDIKKGVKNGRKQSTT